MKKVRLFLFTMMMAFLPSSFVSVKADPVNVPLSFVPFDPTDTQDDPHRGPVLAPEVSIEDYTLTLDDSCLGCTLRLVDENDNVVYTTIINGDTLVLPSTLSGEYELQILFDDCYFYGYIEL